MSLCYTDIVKTISSDIVCTKKTSPEVDSLNGLFLALIATRLCFVHNQVNARLLKPEFDCANLDATYDCGCGDEPVNPPKGLSNDPMDLEVDPSKDKKTGMGLVKGGRAV